MKVALPEPPPAWAGAVVAILTELVCVVLVIENSGSERQAKHGVQRYRYRRGPVPLSPSFAIAHFLSGSNPPSGGGIFFSGRQVVPAPVLPGTLCACYLSRAVSSVCILPTPGLAPQQPRICGPCFGAQGNLDYGTVFHHHLHPTIPTPSIILIDDQRDHSSKPCDPIPTNHPKRRFHEPTPSIIFGSRTFSPHPTSWYGPCVSTPLDSSVNSGIISLPLPARTGRNTRRPTQTMRSKRRRSHRLPMSPSTPPTSSYDQLLTNNTQRYPSAQDLRCRPVRRCHQEA